MAEAFRPRPVYIADSFMLPVGKYDGRHREKRNFFQTLEAVHALLDGAAVKREKIDCVVVGSQNPFAFSGVDNVAAKAAGVLGISGAKSLLVDTASSSGASAFEAAYMEIASGRHENVLAIGIQKMSDVDTGAATRIVAGVIDREEAEFGLTMPACGALVAGALMDEFGLGPEDWTDFSARLTARAQHFAAKNPLAHLDYEIPVEQYYADIENGKNYLYYDPLRYYDFCPMSDGVGACLLTSSPQEVVVAGVGSGTDIPTIADRRTFTTFPATVIAQRYALGMAGLKDLGELEGKVHINMHDPFNGFGPINMADLGVVPRERLLEGLLDERLTGEWGRYPTNLTGGLKGRGHPLGATGMIQIVENHQMVRAGRFKAGLSHSIGGPINNNVVILVEQTRHLEKRNPVPYRPDSLPALSRLKPAGVTLESVFAKKSRVAARLVAQTSRHDYKSGDPTRTLLLFAAPVGKEEYRFLIGLDPAARETLVHLSPGEKLLLERVDQEIRVNDVPIRRFYRRTLEGIMELADTAKRRLRRNHRE
ncbi:thiolase [Desulfuromonas versatilis]|uniref:Thiolase n=1 Tax=Desulfuromonas versatilis TaxID=2802975 RepID=A0ABN6DVH5_9BACT|nr:thiolase family protein [Desulfuromonas versatilis]BCR03519.1 thiolase [Desulfuromonas versatilis]